MSSCCSGWGKICWGVGWTVVRGNGAEEVQAQAMLVMELAARLGSLLFTLECNNVVVQC